MRFEIFDRHLSGRFLIEHLRACGQLTTRQIDQQISLYNGQNRCLDPEDVETVAKKQLHPESVWDLEIALWKQGFPAVERKRAASRLVEKYYDDSETRWQDFVEELVRARGDTSHGQDFNMITPLERKRARINEVESTRNNEDFFEETDSSEPWNAGVRAPNPAPRSRYELFAPRDVSTARGSEIDTDDLRRRMTADSQRIMEEQILCD